ncbi:MAG: GGDEF domain-containing protein [Deltaproteobacteria bacterium]|nr:GGDEF domain-containing protein [Deltaproteobacteria bacterium]
MSQGIAIEKKIVSPDLARKTNPIPYDPGYYEEKIAKLEREVRALRSYKKMAVIDHLTHIFNRRYFDNRLGEEIARMSRQGFPFCVAIVDLDHFKKINDSHGHQVGDQVLRKFAQFLKKNLRRVDVVCRIGGEEFAVIMPDTDITAGLTIMERILQRLIQKPLTIPSHSPVAVSFSCGIVSNCQSFMQNGEILEVADQALYEAKRNGRKQVMARCC